MVSEKYLAFTVLANLEHFTSTTPQKKIITFSKYDLETFFSVFCG
jgi:hypothetical protein